MDPSTISTATFTLKQGTTAVAGTVSYSGVTATFTPTGNLAPLTTYRSEERRVGKDLAGNALATDLIWSFTTGVIPDTTAPGVSATVPANLVIGVAISGQIAGTFSEPMDPLTISTATFTLKQGTTAVAGTVSYSGVTATFTPTGNLAPLTTYTATISTGAKDLAGNALATDLVWSFTTGVDRKSVVQGMSAELRAHRTIRRDNNGQIFASLRQHTSPLCDRSADVSSTHLTTAVAGTVSYSGVTATFTSTGNLAPLTTYTATISTGAKDLAGNALATDLVWSFTTGVNRESTALDSSHTVPSYAATCVKISGE